MPDSLHWLQHKPGNVTRILKACHDIFEKMEHLPDSTFDRLIALPSELHMNLKTYCSSLYMALVDPRNKR
jgi:hypothetical protein